ncbi:MAG: TonB-dependent receptor [Desulfobacterales bacterium]|nr:TonB-dependent receptor [Desulfobacterales bacterium]
MIFYAKGRSYIALSWFFIAFLIVSLSGSCFAEDAVDLTVLSIEELMDVEVTSVAKKSQNLSDSAAAVFVISNDDLRRSGVTSIPEALRMVPGMNVARLDSNKWAVNARGFNGRFSAQLLVLIDGRSVYTPTFSGVYWEVNDVMLEDVDRIEVIRGPGATLWGANAVNGVINIITKTAADTQGGLISAATGNVEKAIGSARYGGKFGESSHWRAYVKYNDRDSFSYVDGEDAKDDWDLVRSGIRVDSTLTDKDNLTIIGDIYESNINQTLFLAQPTSPYMVQTQVDTDASGANLLARWQRTLSSTSEFALQVYYDGYERTEDIVDEERDNFDLDFQHRFALGGNQDIVWGARYRYTDDTYVNSSISDVDPLERDDSLYSAFIQDEISIIPEKLQLTLGSKFEHNDYTGSEIQPSGRLMWSASQEHKFWGSASRAVRTPSRAEHDGTFDYYASFPSTSPLPVLISVSGSEDLESEELMAYELGYRFIPTPKFSLDLTAFYNDYRKIRGFISQPIENMGTYLEQNLVIGNTVTGQTYGIEAAVSTAVTDYLKMHLAYSFLDYDFKDGSVGGFPRHQASLRGQFSFGSSLEFDVWFRYVDDMDATYMFSDTGWYEVDAYLTMDMRFGWKIRPNMELDLIGQNLLDDSRVEFAQEAFSQVTEVERSLFAKLTIRF